MFFNFLTIILFLQNIKKDVLLTLYNLN